MNDTQYNLKRKIMRRVFRSWFLRSTLPLMIFEILVIFFAVFFVARIVFVGEVINNALVAALGNPVALAVYFWGSFWETSITTQGIIILIVVTFVLLLRHLNRIFLSYFLTKRDTEVGL